MSNQFRLLLFIVVISGALCTVEDYVIMSQCAHNKAIHVAAEGTVSVTDISQTQNITIVGLPDYVNNNLKIALYAKETQRYLCFNDQWKLVGMKELRDTCYFNETIVHGYFVFRSVVDLQRRVGFTHRGKAVGPKKNINDACYLFTKIQADQFFHQHTNYFAPRAKNTKNISGLQTTATTHTHTTSGASARLSSQRAALSAAATATATATASASQRSSNKISRNQSNNKNKRVNDMRGNSSNKASSNNNNNQNEEYTYGHSSNLSSNSNNNQSSRHHNNNSSNLDSNSQQQQHEVVVSQQKHHNNSNSRTREHVRQQQQQQHQVRHHHNDPNFIARRQQHEHKQKRRQHQRQQQLRLRLRSGKITSPAAAAATTTTAAAQEHASAATTTQAALGVTATAAAVSGGWKERKRDKSVDAQAVGQQTETARNGAEKGATATTTTMKTTTIANKRKGRRRKVRKQKKQQQKLEQQMLPLRARPLQTRQDDASPTQTTWWWNESPTPPLFSSSPWQALADGVSSISSTTTNGDYSGEWLSSPTTFAGTAAASASPLDAYTASSPSLLSPSVSSIAFMASTTDVTDGFSSLTPTSDYSNFTDFTSEAWADEALNSTLLAEMEDSNMSPEPTSAADIQLNSINSQPQHYTTLNGAESVSEEQDVASTSTMLSESSDHSWSPATVGTEAAAASESDVAETNFPAPTAALETVSDAATATLPDDVNATVETQTANDADLYATMNSTSSETELENSSSSSSDGGFTEALADVAGTMITNVAHRDVHMAVNEPENNKMDGSHKRKRPSSIAASIATLLYNQFLATSSSSNNKYAWKPRRGDEYSDETVALTARPPTEATETELPLDERAAWWQQHMNHSGSNFWDKGFTELSPSASADYAWHKHSKQRNESKHRQRNRSGDSGVAESVSQEPLQTLLSSESSLNYSKKYLGGEGKFHRQGSKLYINSNKLQTPAAGIAQGYSSTMATSRAAATTTIKTVVGATNSTTPSKTMTTTSQQHIYSMKQLLGNKTISALNNPLQLQHFDGNSNHLAHPPTANTLIPLTSSAAPASSTAASSGETSTSTAAVAAATTTKKAIRISTQKLLATPFHQLTYVRNNAGDIDIDNIDNISVYPDLMEDSGELAEHQSTERIATDATRNSRLTIVSGYLPTSATATLPESIRLAKVKINKERKRMMSLRQRRGGRRHA